MTATALVRQPSVAVARATIAHHSKSFALASRLLGPRLRDQTAVVYTWCRRADDAVDEDDPDGDPAGRADADRQQSRGPGEDWTQRRREAEQRETFQASPENHAVVATGRLDLDAVTRRSDLDAVITRLARELDDAYAGRASDPVLAAFGEVAHERNIPRLYPDQLLAGLAMDAAATRYATTEDLLLYCWRVAGVVGLMMSHVFGVADDRALENAAHLGIAMQLTNICRDVAEDWDRDRLYLPDELLARHGAPDLAASLGGPLPGAARPAIARTVEELLAMADRYYRSGDRGLRDLPWRAALAVSAARRVYAAIGRRIARADHDVMAGRAVVPTAVKLAHVARAALRVAVTSPARAWSRRHPRVPARTLELSDVGRL